MELADIAAKIANNARLTPQELDFWKNSMSQTQQNNSFIAGIQNGKSNISARTVKAQKFISGNQSMSGAFLFALQDAWQSIPHNSLTQLTNITIRSGEDYNGFSIVGGTTIIPPEPGKYKIVTVGLWDTNASGFRQMRFDWADGNVLDYAEPGSISYSVYHTLFTEGAYLDSSGFTVSARQTSGGNLNFVAEGIYVERIGEWRWLAT